MPKQFFRPFFRFSKLDGNTFGKLEVFSRSFEESGLRGLRPDGQPSRNLVEIGPSKADGKSFKLRGNWLKRQTAQSLKGRVA